MINLKYTSLLFFLILTNIFVYLENINQKKKIASIEKEKKILKEKIYLKKINWEAIIRPENLKKINDPYPYFRGLIYEIGGNIKYLDFKQPIRKYGKTKNNLYTLYDLAMLGIIKHSKFPIRILTITGMFLTIVSVLTALFYFFMKLIFWEKFQMGIAPIVIGFFIFGAFQIFFLGIIGEYVLNINTQSRNLPLVIEKERVNFD